MSNNVTLVLRGDWPSWIKVEVREGICLNRPCIYEWEIPNKGTYIGKSKRLLARFNEYPNNVRKLIDGLPYRKSKPNSFRRVHHELRSARQGGRTVTFRVLENCGLAHLNEREKYWINCRGTLNR